MIQLVLAIATWCNGMVPLGNNTVTEEINKKTKTCKVELFRCVRGKFSLLSLDERLSTCIEEVHHD